MIQKRDRRILLPPLHWLECPRPKSHRLQEISAQSLRTCKAGRKYLPLADLMGANNIPEDSVDNLLYAFATVAKIASHQQFLESMRQQGIENGWLFTKEKYNELLKEPDGYTKYANRFRQIQNSGADSGLNPLAGLYVEKDIYNSILPMFQQTTRAGNDAASTVMSTSLAVAQRLTGAAMAAKTLFSLGFYLRNALGNVLFFGPAQGYFHAAKDIFSGDPMSGTGMNMFSAIGRAVKGNRAETSAYLRSLEGLMSSATKSVQRL